MAGFLAAGCGGAHEMGREMDSLVGSQERGDLVGPL